MDNNESKRKCIYDGVSISIAAINAAVIILSAALLLCIIIAVLG